MPVLSGTLIQGVESCKIARVMLRACFFLHLSSEELLTRKAAIASVFWTSSPLGVTARWIKLGAIAAQTCLRLTPIVRSTTIVAIVTALACVMFVHLLRN